MTPLDASRAPFNPFSPMSSPVQSAKMSSRPERSDRFFKDNLAQTAPQVQEFVPRNRNNDKSTRHRECSHKSSQSAHGDCLLDLLNVQVTTPPTPPLKAIKGETLSSNGSSSSLHTQSAGTGAGTGGPTPLGAWYGEGQGWIHQPVWAPSLETPITFKPATTKSAKSAKGHQSSGDDYHLLADAGKYAESIDEDPAFNPSIARLSFSTPPPIGHGALHPNQHHHTHPNGPMSDQCHPSGGESQDEDSSLGSPLERAILLAQGLATPPNDRGFRQRPDDDIVFDDGNNTTVFVGGISPTVTEDLLSVLFSPFGDITYVKVTSDNKCGFVQFRSRQHSEWAIKQMNGFRCENCTLRCNWGRPQHGKGKITNARELKAEIAGLCAAVGIPTAHTETVFNILGAVTKGAPVSFHPPQKR